MSNLAENRSTTPKLVVESARKDTRRFRRVRIAGSGRLFLPSTQEEVACTVEEISPGDAILRCVHESAARESAVLYLHNFGRLEGTIVQNGSSGLVMTFSFTPHKRDALIDHLMLELNRGLVSDADLRRHDRVQPASASFTKFTQASGKQVPCEVLDFSPTSLLLRTEIRPLVGEHILMGHRAARVTHHHSEGVGIEFLVPQSSSRTGQAEHGN